MPLLQEEGIIHFFSCVVMLQLWPKFKNTMASGKQVQRTGWLWSTVTKENLEKKFRMNIHLWPELNQCNFQIYKLEIITFSTKLWSPKIWCHRVRQIGSLHKNIQSAAYTKTFKARVFDFLMAKGHTP
jgi:hypothetical protein